MQKFANKFVRDTFQQKIVRRLRVFNPNFDSYLTQARMPLMPRIVLYSDLPNPSEHLKNILPFYTYIKATTANDDYQMAQIVAKSALNEPQNSLSHGVFIEGFPFNVNQALYLDRFLGGVNLALFFRKDSSYKSSISQVLNYYNQKGVLLEIPHQQNLTPEKADKIHWKITSSLKISTD